MKQNQYPNIYYKHILSTFAAFHNCQKKKQPKQQPTTEKTKTRPQRGSIKL